MAPCVPAAAGQYGSTSGPRVRRYASNGVSVCRRTTVNLPDALLQAAKQRAAQQERTLTSLIEEGLRQVLADSVEAEVPTLPNWGTGDGKVLVDLDERAAVWGVLEDRVAVWGVLEGRAAVWGVLDLDAQVRGNLVPDAWIAAVALAHGAQVATRYRGFARFDGLRRIDPLRAT